MHANRHRLGKLFGAALFAALAACDLGGAPDLAAPRLQAGTAGVHPAVVDLRMSGACEGGETSITLRFSKPMDAANVENSLSVSEVLGDVQGGVLPVREGAVPLDEGGFDWENGNRTVTFSAPLLPNRQYVVTLPATAADDTGLGLDGLVGEDVDRDGAADIGFDAEQYARADDDFLAAPADFQSLPIVRPAIDPYGLCRAFDAPSAWLTPRNQSRPRVVDFIGLLPTSEETPRYLPASRAYVFGVTDGAVSVTQPLPARAALRIEIAAPNTSPTRAFPQRFPLAPALPSSVVGNLEISDESLKVYKTGVFLDEQLKVAAPLVGTALSSSAVGITADELAGVRAGALAGALLVFSGRDDLVYALPITGNAGNALWVDPVYYEDLAVTRDDFLAPNVLTLRSGAFRENELKGLRMFRPIANDSLVAEGNTANKVRIRSGVPSCAYMTTECRYIVYTDLDAMSIKGKPFEIVPRHLYLQTQEDRPDGVVFTVRLNGGETPIVDLFGRPFVDGRADGNDLRDEPDDVWLGNFTTGDYAERPIPPLLQLNDGRWYSPFPLGPTVGAVVDFGAPGRFTHLGHGLLGRTEIACRNGGPEARLEAIGMLFATPDGAVQEYGANDLLVDETVSREYFSLYRQEGMALAPLGSSVTGTTVQTAFYDPAHKLLRRWPATLVVLAPARSGTAMRTAGDDGLCGTADDRLANDFRSWQAGDRMLISHLVRYPGGVGTTLDGNYDGMLSDGARDDMIFEYRPGSSPAFARIPAE